ncbi:MAG TPA: DUF882 domain-containing protein [Pseudomonadales bacterium]|nr:DUF882 domain-containing protein [Pseudomonadales bacterium]HNC69812.1 DUF882 domain-containing protein [Pseudomonadales bacterium]HND13889.1 DUF882 domain-containing protein [Pseudomonadales bacterium]
MAYSRTSMSRAAGTGRRVFLKRLALAGAAGMLATPALGSVPLAARAQSGVRELGFLNLHTGERLRVPYWENGRYVDDALGAIYRVLRDHRANVVHAIDTRLLDLLARLQTTVGNLRSYEVISGYRAPSTNEMLRTRSSGVAQGSLHLQGQAIDIRLPGSDLLALHKAAVSLKGGGVGLYRSSNFIHVDTGRVRYW